MVLESGEVDDIIHSVYVENFLSVSHHNHMVTLLNSGNLYPGVIDPIIVRFDVYSLSWVLVADRYTRNFSWRKERLNIESDAVTLVCDVLKNNKVWDITILNSDNSLFKFISSSDVAIINNVVFGLAEYVGKQIELSYASGDYIPDEYIPLNMDEDDDGEALLKRISGQLTNSSGSVIADYGDIVVDEVSADDGIDTDAPIVYGGRYSDYSSDIIGQPIPDGLVGEVVARIDVLNEITQLKKRLDVYENRGIVTTDRIRIDENNVALLPVDAVGSAVFNIAMVFTSKNTQLTDEYGIYTCVTKQDRVVFSQNDGLAGKYAVISFLPK